MQFYILLTKDMLPSTSTTMRNDNLFYHSPCLHIRRADRKLTRIFDFYLKQLGIKSQQYGLLACVATMKDPILTDIGRELSLDQSTVTRNICQLERAGWIAINPHPKDPRKKIASITKAGESKLDEAGRAWDRAREHIVRQMGAEDYSILMKMLDKLVKSC